MKCTRLRTANILAGFEFSSQFKNASSVLGHGIDDVLWEERKLELPWSLFYQIESATVAIWIGKNAATKMKNFQSAVHDCIVSRYARVVLNSRSFCALQIRSFIIVYMDLHAGMVRLSLANEWMNIFFRVTRTIMQTPFYRCLSSRDLITYLQFTSSSIVNLKKIIGMKSDVWNTHPHTLHSMCAVA